MFAAIAQSAPIAVGIIFSSIPLVAVTLALLTRPHKTAVLAFLLGWMAGITLVGSLVLLLADGSSRDAQATPGWLAWARIAIGGLLLALAARQWRSRPRNGAVAPQPTWMDMLDTLSVPKAGGLGLALTTVNPKNLLLVVAGALAILAASPGPLGQWVALIVFTAIASLGVAAPAVLYLVMGDRAAAPLAQTKAWIVQNNATTMATVLLLLGLVVLGNGLEQLQAA